MKRSGLLTFRSMAATCRRASAAEGTPAKTMTLYEGSSQDRYHNPGRPVTVTNAQGFGVLKLTADGSGIFFTSPGASPTGDHPFVATMPATGGKETILFRSKDPFYTDVGPIYGLMLTAWGVGSAFGPLLLADTLKATGAYTSGLHIIAIIMFVSAVLPILVRPPKPREATATAGPSPSVSGLA